MVITLFSPIYPPYRGGGAEYIPWLQRTITEKALGGLHVVTETHPESPHRDEVDGAVVHRTLCSYANFHGPTVARLFRYAIQNVQYLKLLRCVFTREPQILWFHGAFFISANLLIPLLRLVKRVNGARVGLVLDLRDPSISDKRLKRLGFFDEVVSCCRRINQKLRSCGFPPGSYRHIPVAYSADNRELSELPQRLKHLGLEQSGYLLMPHGVRADKNFPLVFDMWQRLKLSGYRYRLLVAGPVVDWDARYEDERTAGNLVLAGEIPNSEVRALMRHAVLVVSIGRMEGLPRSVLEAIGAGALVALPPGVPEFEDSDQNLVIDPGDCDAAVRQVAEVIEQDRRPAYELSSHEEGRIKEKYWELLQELYSATGRDEKTPGVRASGDSSATNDSSA